jgi:hypothetical protein
MVKDRETVKRVLSVIALSVALGFNAEYAVSQTSSIQICQSIEDEKKKRDFAILTRGNVSRKSIQSARRLLNEMLSDKVRESMVGGDYLTLVEDKEFQRYWRSDYKRGMKDKNKSIRIYVAASQVELMLPAVLRKLNSLF